MSSGPNTHSGAGGSGGEGDGSGVDSPWSSSPHSQCSTVTTLDRFTSVKRQRDS